MPATVTLSTTTLLAPVTITDRQINVASTSGLIPGLRLWVDKELMTVVSLGVNTMVNVGRGVDGTAAAPHSSTVTITIGRADQFYFVDPVGRPTSEILVSPYINVRNGKVWLSQGDSTPSLTATRWWQEVTTTYDTGALGVRTVAVAPTSST